MTKPKMFLRGFGMLASCYLILVVVGSIKGCVSHELPVPLTADQRARVRLTHFEFTVGMERPGRADRTTHWDDDAPLMALRGTRLFKTIDYVDRLPSAPDLIVRGTTLVKGTPTVPILTIGTLGVFPTRVEEGWGYAFTFQQPNPGGREIEIGISHKGATVLGWTSGFLNMSAGWAEAPPIKSQRLYDQLALELTAQSEGIRRLVMEKDRFLLERSKGRIPPQGPALDR